MDGYRDTGFKGTLVLCPYRKTMAEDSFLWPVSQHNHKFLARCYSTRPVSSLVKQTLNPIRKLLVMSITFIPLLCS